LQLCNTGDHIVSSITTYGGTFAFLNNYLKKFNIEVTFVDITDLDSVEKAMKPNTKVIYTETMTNPMLQISDIPELKKIAQKFDAKLVVDNTFTPMMVAPKLHGADIVVYSLTKYVNGKNDLVAGAVCADQDFINSLIDLNTGSSMLLGPVLDPLRSSQILKNMHTLHIRMKQHSKNALFLSEKFKEAGINVTYPGFKEHRGYRVFTEMLNSEFGYGGMLAIDMVTSERADALMEMMEEQGVGYLAVSLGYFKTLFSCSGKSTSSEVPEETQKRIGMSEGLVRFSMGLDNDIERTWEKIKYCLIELNVL
jgi:methionine-gamma-lyase